MKLNLSKHMKSKPRTPAYVEEVYHRIEVEMCTARNAVVALCGSGLFLCRCVKREGVCWRWGNKTLPHWAAHSPPRVGEDMLDF